MDGPPEISDRGWFGREVRIARRVSGLSQEQVARRCGMSQVSESRIERGALIPDLVTAKRLAAALGYRLVLRLVPGPGLRLRDTGQMEIAQKIRGEAHPNWRIQLEVPVGAPPDRRAADVVLDLGSEVAIIEIERWLVDFQAQLRAAQLKRQSLVERRSQQVRLILAVPDLPHARRTIAPHAGLVAQVLPVSSRSAWAALRAGMPIRGDALLWVRTRPRPRAAASVVQSAPD
jgi:transcriptional regulator with XRE-family HTH domain